MKNVNIMRDHQFLGEGRSQNNNIYGGMPKRGGGAWTICRGLDKKKRGGCFLVGVDTSMHTMT